MFSFMFFFSLTKILNEEYYIKKLFPKIVLFFVVHQYFTQSIFRRNFIKRDLRKSLMEIRFMINYLNFFLWELFFYHLNFLSVSVKFCQQLYNREILILLGDPTTFYRIECTLEIYINRPDRFNFNKKSLW